MSIIVISLGTKGVKTGSSECFSPNWLRLLQHWYKTAAEDKRRFKWLDVSELTREVRFLKKDLIDANRCCLFLIYGDGRLIIIALKYGQGKPLIIGNF